MLKRLLCQFFIFISVCSYSQINAAIPQQIISHFENEIQGISAAKRDSIKNALLSSYIIEFRSYGKDVAVDSLQARVNRLLSGKGENTVQNIPVKQQPTSKNSPKDPTSLMISNEIKKTDRIADSLTSQMLKTREEFVTAPIYFIPMSHSFKPMSHSDFANYIQISKPDYKITTDNFQFFQTENNSFLQKTDILMFRNKQRRRTINALAVSDPELIGYYRLPAYNSKVRDIGQGNRVVTVDVDEYKTPAFDKLTNFLKPKKQSFWSSNGKLNIQFSQYYVTKNWHKGGEPNTTLLSLLEYYENYNNRDKLIWDNGLDVRIGFFNSGIDTLRAFRVYNDVFKITSRLGYRTFYEKWYYSLYGEFNTCMFTGYAGTNSSEIVTAFLSPTRIFMSLGLDYRYNKNTSVLVAPLAYKLIFLVSDDIDPLSVGIADGKSSNSFGYMLQAKTNWQLTREINVNSNFNLFSTYDFQNVEFNWETIGNFTINRYLSTRLSLNMRFDNTPKKPDKSSKNKYEKPKLQLQEQLSLGFYYRF